MWWKETYRVESRPAHFIHDSTRSFMNYVVNARLMTTHSVRAWPTKTKMFNSSVLNVLNRNTIVLWFLSDVVNKKKYCNFAQMHRVCSPCSIQYWPYRCSVHKGRCTDHRARDTLCRRLFCVADSTAFDFLPKGIQRSAGGRRRPVRPGGLPSGFRIIYIGRRQKIPLNETRPLCLSLVATSITL